VLENALPCCLNSGQVFLFGCGCLHGNGEYHTRLNVMLLWALRPDVGGWVTLSPRYWAGRPSDNDGGQAPYSAVQTVTQVGLPSLPAV